MLVVNIKTEYKADFSDWKMLAERFEVKEHKHFVEGSVMQRLFHHLCQDKEKS